MLLHMDPYYFWIAETWFFFVLSSVYGKLLLLSSLHSTSYINCTATMLPGHVEYILAIISPRPVLLKKFSPSATSLEDQGPDAQELVQGRGWFFQSCSKEKMIHYGVIYLMAIRIFIVVAAAAAKKVGKGNLLLILMRVTHFVRRTTSSFMAIFFTQPVYRILGVEQCSSTYKMGEVTFLLSSAARRSSGQVDKCIHDA